MENPIIQVPTELFEPAATMQFEGTWDMPIMKVGPDLYDFKGPVSWQVDVTNTGEALLVEGTCEVDARTACARCGEPAEVPLFGEVEGYFIIDGEATDTEDMDADEYDILPDDHRIDMAQLIQAALLLDIPVIPLCEDDCKGLCLKCGANLNEGPCSCQDDAEQEEVKVGANNPFAVLKDYVLESE